MSSRHRSHRLFALSGALFTLLALPRRAQATEHYEFLGVGYLHSERSGNAGDYGNGVEVTFVDYIPRLGSHPTGGLGVGAFAHLESVGDPGRLGLSIGPQINFLVFGAEVGIDYLGPSSSAAAADGAYLGGFLSLGLLAIGWHVVLPFNTAAEARSRQGFQHAFTLALKLPLQVGGSSYGFWHGAF